MSDHVIEMKKITKIFRAEEVETHAISEVSLTIDKGEYVAISGPSGCGKSTLLSMMGLLDVPTSGEYIIEGKNTANLSLDEGAEVRNSKIGFIFQSFNLINVLSVYQNVEMPLLLQGRFTKAEREQRIKTIVDRVGLTKFITHRPNELSGGQRQRVSIARALITNPRIVLADEPTANLDSVTGKEIIDLMKEINEQEKTTFIFSTHDDRVVSRVERIIPIEDGLIKTEAAAH